MKLFFKTISFILFGMACGAIGQFDHYADYMDHPVILLSMLAGGAVVFLLLSESDI